MVTVGLAITVAPVVVDNPVAGLHVKLVAPLAVRLTLPPTNMLAEGGVIVIAGNALMMIAAVVVNAVHPLAAGIL